MNLAQLIDGKKTYLVAGAAILYMFGAAIGWWNFNDKVLDALGFGGLITLRAGIAKAGKTAENAENAEIKGGRAQLPVPALCALFALSAFSAVTLLSGCASVGSNPAADAQRIQRISTIAELAAFSGTTYWLKDHPNDRNYFVVAQAALDSLLKDRNYDPQALSAALAGLPVKQLQGDKGALIVSAATILYDGYANEVVHLDQATYIAPVIAAIRNGLFRALNPGVALPPPITLPTTNAIASPKT